MITLMVTLCFSGTTGSEPLPFTPEGELKARIQALWDRYADPKAIPAFTDDFILADVMLSPSYPRRFDEYSGDLSGRFIGAAALLPDDRLSRRLPDLVARVLTYQHDDGCFGNPALAFTLEAIGPEHMALLWGNGRLLTGLMEYYAASHDERVLPAARKLGDFLVGVHAACARPEVAERLKGQGASGFICFTQLIEPLVLLGQATGDSRYLETARQIVPLLEPRGTQHSHGYLTTLRGDMMLTEVTGDPAFAEKARSLYDDLVASDDYTINGGVHEYFGHKGDRDEGCSEADFLRLSLQLWHYTHQVGYLEKAERCLLNIFFAGQFETGDFGHRRYDANGYIPAPGPGRAWWCCTMHCHRALAEVLRNIVTGEPEENALRVNLFLEGSWKQGNRAITISRPRLRDRKAPLLRVAIQQADPTGTRLWLRHPSWLTAPELRLNGETTVPEEKGGYWKLAVHTGDRIELDGAYALRLVGADGQPVTSEQLTGKPVKAALYYGPWLLGVDEAYDTYFLGEPWRENVLFFPEKPEPSTKDHPDPDTLAVPDAHLSVSYRHGGFPDPGTVILRPVSEQARHRQMADLFWLNWEKKK